MALQIRDSQIKIHTAGGYDLSFEIANEDNTDATYLYYGYLSTEGFWIIQRREVSSAASEYKYAAGKTIATYTAAWHATTKLYQGSFTFYRLDQVLSNLQ